MNGLCSRDGFDSMGWKTINQNQLQKTLQTKCGKKLKLYIEFTITKTHLRHTHRFQWTIKIKLIFGTNLFCCFFFSLFGFETLFKIYLFLCANATRDCIIHSHVICIFFVVFCVWIDYCRLFFVSYSFDYKQHNFRFFFYFGEKKKKIEQMMEEYIYIFLCGMYIRTRNEMIFYFVFL